MAQSPHLSLTWAAACLGLVMAGCTWEPLPNLDQTATPTSAATQAPSPTPTADATRAPTATPIPPTGTPEGSPTPCVDVDGDGFCLDLACLEEACPTNAPCFGDSCPTPPSCDPSQCPGADCDDGDVNISPQADELCDDGIDQDCDGVVDEWNATYYYRDGDGDGYGDKSWLINAEECEPPENYVANGDDCDDTNALINPGRAETLCNGVNEDCNDRTLDVPNDDGDGYDACPPNSSLPAEDGRAVDCDDEDPAINPGATEIANAVDDNCDGLVLVANTPFVMGSDLSEGESPEFPEHVVTPAAFYIMTTEVSVAQYDACIAAGVCDPRPSRTGCNRGDDDADLPVNCVTYYDAQAYCQFHPPPASLPGDRQMGLPTEAQWERAARGDCLDNFRCDVYSDTRDGDLDERDWPWGSEPEPTCDLANFDPADDAACTPTTGAERTWPVSSLEAGRSPVGAHHMAGNVAEWVADCFHDSYFDAPTDGSEWTRGCFDEDERVLRGGSYLSSEADIRVAARRWASRTYEDTLIGFRCAILNTEPVATPTPAATAAPTASPSDIPPTPAP